MMAQKSSRTTMGAPTITDVAQAAGFSPMTVSRVINGEKNVRASTREAVLEAIARLNYSPNMAARALAGADAIRVGLIYSNPSAAYLSRFLLGALEQARSQQIQFLIEKCEYDPADEESAVRDILAAGVDGIIISPPLCDSEAILQLLHDADIASVAVSNWRPPSYVSVVRIDDRAAAAEMTRYLLKLGHKRIAFVLGKPEHKASHQRLLGYYDALAEAGIAVDADLVTPGDFTFRSGMTCAETLFDLAVPPTAIFASNDDMAAGLISVAHRRHLDVPREVTICGFDDTDFALSIWPELTTVHQPIADMAAAAVDLLIEQVRARRSGKPLPPREIMLDHTLIVRGSASAVPVFEAHR